MMEVEFCDLNVEFCHVYQDEIERRDLDVLLPNIDVTRQCLDALERRGLPFTTTILIDDYSRKWGSRDVAPLLGFLKEYGLHPDYIAFESDLVTVAPAFLEKMKKRHLKQRSGEILLYVQTDDPHFPQLLPGIRPKARLFADEDFSTYSVFNQRRLRSDSQVFLVSRTGDDIRYSCPLLAACWVLARLGKPPFAEAIRLLPTGRNRPFFGRRLINILPTHYLKVETTVLDLLSQLRDQELRKCHSLIQYWFHPQEVREAMVE